MAGSRGSIWGTVIKFGVIAVVIWFVWTLWQNFVQQQDIYAIGGQQVSSPPTITNNWYDASNYGWANPGGTTAGSGTSAPAGGGSGGLLIAPSPSGLQPGDPGYGIPGFGGVSRPLPFPVSAKYPRILPG